jgi:hypothetical protein
MRRYLGRSFLWDVVLTGVGYQMPAPFFNIFYGMIATAPDLLLYWFF